VSAPRVIHLIEHSQVVYQIEHCAPVRAIVGTLLTTLVGPAVAAFFNRRQIAWRAYVDAPITLDANLVKNVGARVKHKVYVGGDPDLLTDVETIPGAIGYAQTGDAAGAPSGTLESVALNGLSASF
jgi:hypothetical protein